MQRYYFVTQSPWQRDTKLSDIRGTFENLENARNFAKSVMGGGLVVEMYLFNGATVVELPNWEDESFTCPV